MSSIPQLSLKPFTAESLLAMIDSPSEFSNFFGIQAADGLREFFVSDDLSHDWIRQLRRASGANPWQLGFAVVDEINNLVVGTAGFKGPPTAAGMVEIAYGIVPSFESRGYATEVAGRLVSFALKDPRVRIIRAHTLPAENGSTRVLTKNGFLNLGDVMDPDDGLVWRWEFPIPHF